LGHASVVIDVGGSAFTPATVTAAEGDLVNWVWKGPDGNHSVTSDGGQSESFDSDAGKASGLVYHPQGDEFTYFFAKAGAFAYYCKVHPEIRGTVVVQPLTGGANPAPRIAGLRAAIRPRRKLRVTFRLSADAGVTVRIRRAGTRRVVRSKFRFADRGRGAMTVSLRGLRPGRYSVSARAVDGDGKGSKLATTKFRLKRG
jgi:plastocyanin